MALSTFILFKGVAVLTADQIESVDDQHAIAQAVELCDAEPSCTGYEIWLKSQDISKTTIGIYLRPLRAVFNEAIEAKIIRRETCYPFGKRKYRIPSSKKVKKALELVPGHPVASNECGLLYRKKGRFDEARAMYEQALAAYPNYYPAHRNLGILCDLYLNDLESAMAHYQVYSQAMPKDNKVKLWIADLQARMGGK